MERLDHIDSKMHNQPNTLLITVSLFGHTNADICLNAMVYIHNFLVQLPDGRIEVFGYANDRLTKTTKKWPRGFQSIGIHNQ